MKVRHVVLCGTVGSALLVSGILLAFGIKYGYVDGNQQSVKIAMPICLFGGFMLFFWGFIFSLLCTGFYERGLIKPRNKFEFSIIYKPRFSFPPKKYILFFIVIFLTSIIFLIFISQYKYIDLGDKWFQVLFVVGCIYWWLIYFFYIAFPIYMKIFFGFNYPELRKNQEFGKENFPYPMTLFIIEYNNEEENG